MLHLAHSIRRGRTWPTLVLLSAIGLLSGCEADDALAPALNAPTVEGVVTASITGEPIAGARVSIGAATVTTGPDGRYALAGLTAGPATLRCIATGFEDFEADITVSSGAASRDIALTRATLHIAGDMSAQQHVSIHVDQAGRDVNDAVVTVNGVGIPHAGQGLYERELPDAVPDGSQFILNVSAGGMTVEAVGSVPETPVLTAPATGGGFTVTDSISFAWSSTTDPDRFAGPFGPVSGGVRQATIAARDIACDLSDPFPLPYTGLESSVTREIRVSAVRDLIGHRDFTGQADHNSLITIERASSPTAITITPTPVLCNLGVYDLTALIESYDPAWGVNMDGAFYTAVVTLDREIPHPSQVRGSFTDWRVFLPDGEGTVEPDGTGTASGHFHPDGEVVIEVDRLLWYLQGMVLDSGDVSGTWGCCGHISGTFTATRRSTE